MYKRQLNFQHFQEELEKYLNKYTNQNFSKELSVDNLPLLFNHAKKDERNWCAIYLYPLLGDKYVKFYIENGYKDYLYTLAFLLNNMNGHILFNSYLVDELEKEFTSHYGRFYCNGRKIFPMVNVQDVVYGVKRVLWSFIVGYSRENNLKL